MVTFSKGLYEMDMFQVCRLSQKCNLKENLTCLGSGEWPAQAASRVSAAK